MNTLTKITFDKTWFISWTLIGLIIGGSITYFNYCNTDLFIDICL